jgi:signal transduction histidine kinase
MEIVRETAEEPRPPSWLEAVPGPREWQEDLQSLQRTLRALQKLMRETRDGRDLTFHFDNPYLVPCWQVKGCTLTACPCYGKPAMRCWQAAGTHCAGQVGGLFARRLEACEACEVYRRATPTPVLAVNEAFDNMMHRVHLEHLDLVEARRASEDASRAKSTFLGTMSHELRTPLHGILALANLTLGTDLGPEQRENLSLILQSGEGLLAMLSDIVEFTAIEAGKIQLEDADFDLPLAVHSAIARHAPQACDKGIEVACRIGTDVPRRVRGDRGRLEQALAHLVGNAVKFTASGEVVVEVLLEETAPDGPRLRFEVSDTGIGIPADQIERIFQPFTQVDSSMSRRFEGIGLGLAIARRLAEVLGGHIDVESTEGKGSKFSFTARFASGLPALDFAGGPAPPEARSEAPEPCSTPTEPCSEASEPCSAASEPCSAAT